jgi:predicted nucleic acid-binding protein
MTDRWVLDTNIIAGYAKGVEASTRLIDERGEVGLFTSVISRMELISPLNLPPDEKLRILQFLEQVTVAGLNEDVEETAILIRGQTKIKLPDSIIAATAVVLEAPLFTFDRCLASLSWQGLSTIVPV